MRQVVNGVLAGQKRILLAKRSGHRKVYPGLWSFPGGHVERGERLEGALVRELKEELGEVRSLSNLALPEYQTLVERLSATSR